MMYATAPPAVTTSYSCEQVTGPQPGYEHEQWCLFSVTVTGPARGWQVAIRAPRGERMDLAWQEAVIPAGTLNSAMGSDFAPGIRAPYTLRGGAIGRGWQLDGWFSVTLPAAFRAPDMTIHVQRGSS